MENIPAIISSIAVILSAWFSYNQYAKNKLTDLKIEKWKAAEEEKSAKRSDNIAKDLRRAMAVASRTRS